MSVSVSATGAENLVYLWKKDGEDITHNRYIGTNSSTLTINTFLSDDQGKYMCIIKNCNSTIDSEQADLSLGMFISSVYKNTIIFVSIHRRIPDF